MRRFPNDFGNLFQIVLTGLSQWFRIIHQMHDAVTEPVTNGPSRAFWTFLITALGLAVVFVDISIVNVALQSISAGFKAGVTDLEWIVDAYTLAFAGCLLTAGAIGDRFGNKGIFLVGILLFVASSLVCGVAPSLGLLIAGRVLQGVGAALIIPSSLTLLNHAYEDPRARAKAFGAWGACGAMAIAAGPLMGGLLIHLFGWRSIFLVNVPVGAMALILGSNLIQKEKQIAGRRIDVAGLVTSLIALTALVGALVEGPRFGWSSVPIIGSSLLFLLCSVIWVLVESRQSDPMLPLELFRVRQFSVICVVGLLGNIAMYGALFTFSLYLQKIRHLTPFETGLTFLPMSGLMALGNLISGRVAAKHGGHVPVLIGLLIAGAFYGWIAFTATETINLAFLVAQMAAIGIGVSFVVPPMVAICLGSVEKSRIGVASGALNMSRQVGTAAGVALLGSLLTIQSGFMSGFCGGLMLASALCFMAAALTFFFVPPTRYVEIFTVPIE
jgi:MFS transporter, DHA2 family, methylenomycin A resistance protein